ncbi:FtsQ-type POTRA domain-containing protein [Epidermidibacterium keratini]|uniref:FtsQ-type POTRA domain-containing protein n=1 Tax=Epidermidibacterium keratini TaxID=1891644 RepID=A0A7L4YIZ2_9ACTN|nr:FtsQ-type POTRA domain-containing protein [Epidermidibacterium keratini]QHB99139.1 FtsQ-type POTRA domain-containing protein [Epidermidibacterium keratini]
MLGLVGVLLVGIGGWLVYFSSLFGVRDIKIEGTALVDSSEVEQIVGLGPNDALASVDLQSVASTIEQQLPPVKSAEVRRSWPSTLVVTIAERTPVATVTRDGAPWLIDDTGTPYLAASDYPDELPTLLPLEVKDPSPQSLATREAVTVIAGLSDDVRELVSAVSAPSAGEVTLQLSDGRVVIWGDSSRMQDKLTMLPGVLEHPGSEFDISSPQAIVIK